MPLIASYIVPHPPVAVHEVGRGREEEISATIGGYEDIAKRIASLQPDDIIVISPHAAYYADWIYMAGGDGASGTLAQFQAPQVSINLTYDTELRDGIELRAQSKGVAAGTIDDGVRELDHGTLVPLSFVDKEYPSDRYKAVLIGGSALPRPQLTEFGRCIARVCDSTDRKCVLLVSGDLSHKLTADGPYGFDPAGPLFDEAFEEIVRAGELSRFGLLEASMCESAAECGLSGFVMMAGAIEQAISDSGMAFSSELISHEGPFGVGYGVAAFEREDSLSVSADGECAEVVTDDRFVKERGSGRSNGRVEDGERDLPDLASERQSEQSPEGDVEESPTDPLVALAWKTIIQYANDRTIPEPSELPADVPDRAGCFVSIHVKSTGELRGCIGTIEPVQSSLANEIIANAISASTRDPRFPAISPVELDDLEINVDVLFPAEPATLDQMDPKRYGIIVEQGFKRGLLLPDLDGVDTVEDQFRIACMKAGIDPSQTAEPIDIQRFEVVRHK